MISISTVHLSADTTAASVEFGQTDLGELTEAEFVALLERFRRLDSVQNSEVDPQILITARAGRFIVRTGQGKLFLYNARNTTEPYAELSAEEIFAHLERPAPAATVSSASVASTSVKPAAPHRATAFAILVAGLALNGYTLYSAFYTDRVGEKTVITLLTAADELAARQRDVIGTYATGAQPGDRVITVGADGSVKFSEVASTTSINNSSDTYRLGRREKQLCLATVDSGVVDILNIDTLVYYRDTYKRR